MAKKDNTPQISVSLVLQSLDGGVASFNVVTPERGADPQPIVGAYCTLTIADGKLFDSLTVGDTFDVTFTKPEASAKGPVTPRGTE